MASWSDRIAHERGYLAKGSKLLGRCLRAHPFLCNWQITYRCNFRCEICTFWRQGHHPARELGLAEVAAVADKLRPLGPLVISMAGGEPLLRKDLPEICELLSRDHYFTIITNGWFLTPELARRLYAAGLQDAHVSIDSVDPRQHDALRGVEGSFDRAVRAAEMLRDARPDRRHRVHLLSVLLDDNAEQIEAMIDLAGRLGVSFELSLYSARRGELPDRRPRQPLAARLRELKRRYPETFVSMGDYLRGMDRATGPEGVRSCHAGRTFFNIDDRGRLSRCIDRNESPVGSLLDEPLEPLLRRLATECELDPCTDCWTSCRGFADMMAGPLGLARSLPDFYRAVRPL